MHRDPLDQLIHDIELHQVWFWQLTSAALAIGATLAALAIAPH